MTETTLYVLVGTRSSSFFQQVNASLLVPHPQNKVNQESYNLLLEFTEHQTTASSLKCTFEKGKILPKEYSGMKLNCM